MTGLPRRLAAGVLCLLTPFVPAAASAAEGEPRYAGRPVADVLLELRGPDLEFLFSSERVPATLRVLSEPRATERLLVAREILEPHGLALQALRPGLYSVVVTPGGVRPRPGAVADDAPDSFPPEVQLAEVVVSTSRYSFDRMGGFGAIRIEGDALAAQPVLGEDAIRSFGRIPGVAQNGVSARSNIRGGEEGEVLTLLDGFPLRQAFHIPGYQSLFGLIDPGLVAETEIYTGGFPVRYGNRMAGVFDLRTVEPDEAAASALGLSVFNAMARRSGRSEPMGVEWLAAARIGTLEPFIEWFAHDAGKPRYADAYARFGHGDTATLRVTGNALWARDELSIAREGRAERAEIESRARYAWLRADRDLGEDLRASIWLGHSRVDAFRTGRLDQPAIAVGEVADWRASSYRELRSRLDWQAGERQWLEGGIEWIGEDANYRYQASAVYSPAVAELFSRDATLDRASELHPSRERLALFASHRWQIAEPLISEVGLRAQRTITGGVGGDEWLFDPRINLSWQFRPDSSLRAHWGRFHQADEVHELKVEDGLTQFPGAQRSDHLIVGIDHRLAAGPSLRLEWFRKLQSDPRPRFENLLDPLSLIPEIAPDRIQVTPLAAEIQGAELSLASQRDALNWWLALAWSEALDSLGGRQVPRSWDQTWSLSGGIDWQRGRWRYGAFGLVRRGWPTTTITEDGLQERNASRLPTRAAIDLRAEYRRSLAAGNLSFTVELTNALNIGNECCQKLVPAEDGSGGVIFRTRTSDWLPLVPSIGVLWEF